MGVLFYKKKPVVIQAIQWLISNLEDVENFVGADLIYDGDVMKVNTLEGISYEVQFGDYIIKGVNGEFYPCKPDIFKKTYSEVK